MMLSHINGSMGGGALDITRPDLSTMNVSQFHATSLLLMGLYISIMAGVNVVVVGGQWF